MNPQEWMGKFSSQQQKHQYPNDDKPKGKFAEMMLGKLNKFGFSKTVCGLCMV